mmetsp:Transcript_43870/g.131509  ORF Transcript_43870/g.131509 Transcript_43870/m.131509 type:complete len:237 (-) Transcript_43870:470-1180(-)
MRVQHERVAIRHATERQRLKAVRRAVAVDLEARGRVVAVGARGRVVVLPGKQSGNKEVGAVVERGVSAEAAAVGKVVPRLTRRHAPVDEVVVGAAAALRRACRRHDLTRDVVPRLVQQHAAQQLVRAVPGRAHALCRVWRHHAPAVRGNAAQRQRVSDGVARLGHSLKRNALRQQLAGQHPGTFAQQLPASQPLRRRATARRLSCQQRRRDVVQAWGRVLEELHREARPVGAVDQA